MAESQPTSERWLPVTGYEGLYEVSDHGRVRSLDRQSVNRFATFTRRGQTLRPTVKESGHLYVSLWREGEMKKAKVHRMVLEAFVGPCPEGMEACHWNDVPADNRLSNLRWATATDNKLDAVRNGTHVHARKTACKRGHAFAGNNLRIGSDGNRYCRTCDKTRRRVRADPQLASRFDEVAAGIYREVMGPEAVVAGKLPSVANKVQ